MAGSYLYAESSKRLVATVLRWGDRGKLMLPEVARTSVATFVVLFSSFLIGVLVVLNRLTVR